jgi:hypothetical protein
MGRLNRTKVIDLTNIIADWIKKYPNFELRQSFSFLPGTILCTCWTKPDGQHPANPKIELYQSRTICIIMSDHVAVYDYGFMTDANFGDPPKIRLYASDPEFFTKLEELLPTVCPNKEVRCATK